MLFPSAICLRIFLLAGLLMALRYFLCRIFVSSMSSVTVEDFSGIVSRSLKNSEFGLGDINAWCIHPGGKRILEAIEQGLCISREDLSYCYDVLNKFGNMSSATILFVLKDMLSSRQKQKNIFASAFGPGLTVETFTASL